MSCNCKSQHCTTCYPRDRCGCGHDACNTCNPCRSVSHCCDPPHSIKENPTFGELVSWAQHIQCNLEGYTDLSKRHVGMAELLPRLDDLCRQVNVLSIAVNQLQIKDQQASNCSSTLIVSISPT